MQLTFEVPNKYVALNSPAEFVQLLKINTAIDFYQSGQMSSGAAAEFIGGMDKYEFLYECRKRGVEPRTYESIDELLGEVEALETDLN